MIITLDEQMCWNPKAGEAVMGMMRITVTVRITGRTIMLVMVMSIMTRTGMAVTSRRRRVGCVSGSPWKECGSDARYLPESQHLLPPSSKLLLGRVTVRLCVGARFHKTYQVLLYKTEVIRPMLYSYSGTTMKWQVFKQPFISTSHLTLDKYALFFNKIQGVF